MPDRELLRIAIPTVPEAPVGAETCWAEPLGDRRFRIDNILAYTDGVSLDDVVRCDVAGDGTLVAVELLERSGLVTLSFATTDEDDLRRLENWAQELLDRTPDDVDVLVFAPSLATVCFPVDQLEAVASAAVLAARTVWTDPTITFDADQQEIGPLGFWAVSSPDYDAPEPIAGADELLARHPAPDLVALDWPAADDPIAAGWPDELTAGLRDRATDNPQLAAMLDRRLYHQILTLQLRMDVLRRDGSTDRLGPQLWPLGPDVDPDDGRQRWEAARGPDGQVRYAADDRLNRQMRDFLAGLGLDPDADPYQPASGP